MAEDVLLIMYSRPGCHLCEEMARILVGLSEELRFAIKYVNIDKDPALVRRFNELVPVLMHGERELARYQLNSEAIRAYMAEIR